MVKVPKPVIEDIRMWLSFNNKDNLLSRLDACLEPDDRKLSDLVGRLRSRLSEQDFVFVRGELERYTCVKLD